MGSAKMDKDGTIILTLRAEGDGKTGGSEVLYRRGDPEYQDVLRHLGGLRPGEEKVVLPFPDD